jgi:hypothetical protein
MRKAIVYATVLADRIIEKYGSTEMDETWVWMSGIVGRMPSALRPQAPKMLHVGATYFQCTLLMTEKHVGLRLHYGRPAVPHTAEGQPIH